MGTWVRDRTVLYVGRLVLGGAERNLMDTKLTMLLVFGGLGLICTLMVIRPLEVGKALGFESRLPTPDELRRGTRTLGWLMLSVDAVLLLLLLFIAP